MAFIIDPFSFLITWSEMGKRNIQVADSVVELESHCLKSLEKVPKVSSTTIAKHLTGCGKMRVARKAINSL